MNPQAKAMDLTDDSNKAGNVRVVDNEDIESPRGAKLLAVQTR